MALGFIEELINSPHFTIFSLLAVFCGLLYIRYKNRNLPPGPTGVPILGYWPFFEEETVHLQLTEFKKKYGDVYSVNVAGKLLIHLGSMKAVKEAYVTKADYFSHRSTDYSVLNWLFDEGVISVNGENWSALRKFFVQRFREHGLSSLKEYMAGPVYDSVNACISKLKATAGKPANVVPILESQALDIIRILMFRSDLITDEELTSVALAFSQLLTFGSGVNVLLTGNIARYLIFPRIKGYKETLQCYKTMDRVLTNVLRRHETSFDPDNVRDMVDSYIRERNERRRKGDPTAKYFTDAAFVNSVFQMVGDGIATIGGFIAQFLNTLAKHPEEQEKIFKELEDLAGPDRQITLEDRNKLPYTNAFIQEVQRTAAFLTIFIGFECKKNTTLQGYRIPKGAITFLNFWACHNDPKTYEDPDVFNPSRFLAEPGKPKTETPIVFGVGRRSCVGESFVMMQVFLSLTNIVRNFRIEDSRTEAEKPYFDGKVEVSLLPRK